MASCTQGGKVGAILEDDDYLSLEKLLLILEKESLNDDGTLRSRSWNHFLEAWNHFLTIEANRKLTQHHLWPPVEDGAIIREDLITVVADQSCAMEKWVHIGCEIGLEILRLHLNGGAIGERKADYLHGNKVDLSTILLSGGDGSTDNGVQGYPHYVRVLPQPTVANHYVKNPPLELSLDGSTGAFDDHEVKEGRDGV